MDLTRNSDDRLSLSPFRPSDAAALYAADRDPEHRRRFDFPPNFTPSLRHAAAVIAQWEQEGLAGTRLPFAIRDATNGAVLGGCELRPLEHGGAALAYWTLPAHRRQGVATRAVRLACGLATRLGFKQLEAEVDLDNAASRRVVERNGFESAGMKGGREVLRRALPAEAAQPELAG